MKLQTEQMEKRSKKPVCLRGLRVPEREEVSNGLSRWEEGVEDGMMSLPTSSTISNMTSLHIITNIIFLLLTKNSLEIFFSWKWRFDLFLYQLLQHI